MAEIIFSNIVLKTKTGSREVEGIVHLNKPKEELQTDEHFFARIFRDRLEGWKKDFVTDKISGYPVIMEIKKLKSLGESFV